MRESDEVNAESISWLFFLILVVFLFSFFDFLILGGCRDDIRDLVHASSIQYPDAARVPDMISHGLKEIENAAMREIHNVFETNQVWTMETVQATFAPLIQFSRPFP